ncbi:MAG: ribonuclease III [Desulfomonilaceae bacterium]
MCSDENLNIGNELDYVPEVESVLGYRFTTSSHLVNALTRRSFWHENRDFCLEHNERLEFLGDAVIGLVIANMLYREFPNAEEGELQKKRASIVNKKALASVMRGMNLANFVRMGRGDELSGCRDRDSVLADTLEALIAAVYLDGGFDRAEEVIEKHFNPLVSGCATVEGIDDCKSVLQERAQGQLGITPTYQVMDQWGEDHQKMFRVGVYLGNQVVGVGHGRNKREAQQNAAREALSNLK